MRDVQLRLGLRGELDVALHDESFSFLRHSAQAESKRGWAGIHGGAAGESRVFGMLDHGQSELSGLAQNLAHDGIVEYGLAVISQSRPLRHAAEL